MTSPFGPNWNQGDPNAGTGVPFGVSRRKPSILDRVAARLFPTAAYTGLLDPSQQEGLSRQGLLQVGLNLMQAGAPSAHQGGTLANIAGSIRGVPFEEMAKQAVQLRAYQQSERERQALTAVAAHHPARPGETPEQTYDRIAAMVSDLAAMPGSENLIGKLSGVLTALRPRAERNDWMIQAGVGSDGQPELYRINRLTGEVRATGLGKVPSSNTLGGVAAQETRAAAKNALAALDNADKILGKDSNADILPTATAVARGAERIPFIGSALSGLTEPIAQHAMSNNQKLYQQAMDQFLHNYSSLLPRGGRSVQILRNLRASFTPPPGATAPEVRAGFARARADLRRTLQDLAAGKQVSQLPGTDPDEASINAQGAADVQAPDSVITAPQVNPLWWRKKP